MSYITKTKLVALQRRTPVLKIHNFDKKLFF